MTTTKKSSLPLIPLRDLVLFPGIMGTLFVGRESSKKALSQVGKQQRIALFLQKDSDAATIDQREDLHEYGVVARILKQLLLPDGVTKVLVEGVRRVKIKELSWEEGGYWSASTKSEPYSEVSETISLSLSGLLMRELKHYDNVAKKLPAQLLSLQETPDEPNLMLDTAITQCSLSIEQSQPLLSITDTQQRYEMFLSLLQSDLTRISVEETIKEKIKKHINKNQREYYLQEQMKAIQKELGNTSSPEDEASKFEQQAQKANLPQHVMERVESELKKLRSMNSLAAEASIVRGYVEWILSLPWNSEKTDKISLKKCENVLNQHHHGLTKIKERVLEHLALQERCSSPRGQILCLVGPPGVGKTSLCTSIAEAINRPFVRCALGGVHDEGEIRGHRRTYIGSMPGKILQGMKKAKSVQPVFLLDEIDKMGRDWRGDPSSALLEVLDPEQNSAFNDHYLEVDYDLSKVLFIATANSLNIPAPLLDRLDIIRLEGYTEEEKLFIAKQHLLPKTLKKAEVSSSELSLQQSVIPQIIELYTREAGVRDLTRHLETITRKAVRALNQNPDQKVTVTKASLSKFLGPALFPKVKKLQALKPGAACGLAWSSTGGSTLYVEALKYAGKGKMILTGHLGKVMNESAQIALSLAKSYAQQHALTKNLFQEFDIHIHIPDGAIPKDGPSAGITMTTAIVSLITKTPVHSDIAMTGEVTLQGHVHAIGGLKDKLLAALRAGMKKVLIPEDNKKDLEDLPKVLLDTLTIVPVKHMDEVLDHALTKPVVYTKNNQEYQSWVSTNA